MLLIRRLGARETRWQWVPLTSAVVAVALAIAPSYGLTQLLAPLTLVPTALAWRKVRDRRMRVFYVGSLVNVVAVLAAIALVVALP